MYRLTGFVLYSWQHYWREIFFTVPDCLYIQMDQTELNRKLVNQNLNKPNPATKPHWTPLAFIVNRSLLLCYAEEVQSGSDSAIEEKKWRWIADFCHISQMCVPVCGLKQGSGSGSSSGSGSFHCHPAQADCFLLTRNERGIFRPAWTDPQLCFTAQCLESQSESGWFPYLWREEDTPVL